MIAIRPDRGAVRLPSIGIYQEYSADIATLWSLITDTGAWPLWGPTVRAVRCPGRYIGHGTRGHVQTAFGIWLPFEVTSFQHLGFWLWRVAGVTATGHEVAEGREGRGRLIFWVPVWACPYLLVCWWALMRIRRLVA